MSAVVELRVPATVAAVRVGSNEDPIIRVTRTAILTGPVVGVKSKWRIIFVFVLYF